MISSLRKRVIIKRALHYKFLIMVKRQNLYSIQIKGLTFTLIQILILAVVYHLAARFSLKMAFAQANTSPVWLPTGIGLATLLLFGIKLWPGITIGVLIGSLLSGATPFLAFGMAFGNTLESLVCAYALKKIINFHNAIDRVQDVIGLSIISILGTTISATIGTSTLLFINQSNWTEMVNIWSTWWIGDLLGAIVIAPVLLVWLSPSLHKLTKRLNPEGFILLFFIILIAWYVFGFGSSSGILHQSLIYVIFPIVIWAALRFGQRGATICITLVSGIAISGTIRGVGPFSMGSLNDSLVLLQTFTGVLAFIALLLAASTIERQKASRALNRRVNNLVTLNDSSRRFLDNFDFKTIYQTICELSVDRLGLDGAWLEIEGIEHQNKSSAFYGVGQGLMEEMKSIWEQNLTSQDWENVLIRTKDNYSPSDNNSDIFQSYAALPLVFNGEKIGVLKLLSKNSDFFTNDCIQLTRSYANLAAVAIKNTWLYDQIQQGNNQLQALSQRLLKAHEEERLHLSRELHDESGQLLAALSVQMGILKRDSSNNEPIRQRINEVIGTLNKLQKNLHKLAVDLRPASLDHLGLVNALQQHTEEFSRHYNIKVEFEAVSMEDVRLSIEVETALFRIVQEALTNVALHADATWIDVLISRNNNLVAVIVEDNGIGFKLSPVTTAEHLGLFGMRERIEMLGGIFTLESTIDEGTTVKAEITCND